MQMKWKGNGAIGELGHVLLQAMKVGTEGGSLSVPIKLQTAVAK